MNKKIRKTKTQKGITLVALIITIVVLLILAMVAIGAVQDSKIIAHAQNAAGSFNQAKNNEVDSLIKYEEEIEKYAPGEKKEYIGNLRLNTKYLTGGKFNYVTAIFYSDGTADIMGTKMNYTLNNDELEVGGLELKVYREENNDILINNENGILATSQERLIYFNGQKYVNGEKEIILNEENTKYNISINNKGNIPNIPVLYNGVIWGARIDGDGDDVEDIITSTDNGETIVLCGEVFTKVTE